MTFLLKNSKKILTVACASVLAIGCSNMNNKSASADDKMSDHSSVPSLNTDDIITGESDASVVANITENLKKSGADQTNVISAHPTNINGMYWVVAEGTPAFFADKSGEHIFQGQVLDISNGTPVDVSAKLNERVIKDRLAAVPEKDMIIYPAKGDTKSKIFVFTDSTCPYCQKLHEDIDELNTKGIEVRYLAWPRNDRAFPILESVWCSDDRIKALNDTKAGIAIPSKSCDSPVKQQTELGFAIGVRGTPAVYSESGVQLGGYIPPERMAHSLGLE